MLKIGIIKQFMIVLLLLTAAPFFTVTIPTIFHLRQRILDTIREKQQLEISAKVEYLKEQIDAVKRQLKIYAKDPDIIRAFDPSVKELAQTSIRALISSHPIVHRIEVIDLNYKLSASSDGSATSLVAENLKANPIFLGSGEVGIRILENVFSSEKDQRAIIIAIPLEVNKEKQGHLVSIVRVVDCQKEVELSKDDHYTTVFYKTKERMHLMPEETAALASDTEVISHIAWIGFEDKFIPIYIDQPKSFLLSETNQTVYLLMGITVLILITILIFIWLYIKTVRKQLSQMIVKLTDGSSTLDKTGNDLVSISTETLNSTTNLKTNILKTATSIEEMKIIVDRTERLTQKAEDTAKQCEQIVNNGRNVLENMQVVMSAIQNQNGQVKNELELVNKDLFELSKAIQDVSEKTNIINEIVFQTRILSFNASVEAARAGDQGKGFSVVAQEVGSLANMSGNAAIEITQMIVNNVERVGKIVKSVEERINMISEESTQKVSAGLQVSQQAHKSFDMVQASFDEIKDALKEIRSSSERQAQTISMIREAMIESKAATQSGESVAQKAAEQSNRIKDQVTKITNIADRMDHTLIG